MSLSVDQTLRKANRHANRGEAELAARLYESILEQYPKNARAIAGLKALGQPGTVESAANASPSRHQASPSRHQIEKLIELCNQGRLQDALEQGNALTQQFPDLPLLQNLLGVVNVGLGSLERAEACFTKAVRIKPDYVEAHNNLGNTLVRLGKPEQAAASYGQALKIRPDFAEAHNNLGNALCDLGKFEKAVSNFAKAVQIKSDYAEAHFNLGNALGHLGKTGEAVSSFTNALRIRPDYAEAHRSLGNVLQDLGEHEGAVASLMNALRIRPDYAEAHFNLGDALANLGKLEAAVASYRRGLEIEPNHAQAHNSLGIVLRDLRKPEAAIGCYDKALEINPDYAEAHNNRANALRNLGELAEAVAGYERALEINPDYVGAHRNLSTAKKYHDGDPQIQQMLQLAEGRKLSDGERTHLGFALAKALGDIGHYDQAFSYLSEANRLRKAQLNYDISSARQEFTEILSTFSRDLRPLNVAAESASATGQQPAFVLGMPRSGTTLVEQILASHSQVHGAGELNFLDMSVIATEWSSMQLGPDQLQSIRRSYFSGLKQIGASEPFVTDKHLLNFRWIGFICAAIPEARIVHVRRDARATCWSNFKHYFASDAIGFAYDLRDIAEYYNLYVELMEFWEEKLPGRIYHLNYETLTEHQEIETRKLLEYVGLDWEDQCLEFHKTTRAVQTASATQVRQKMYQGSSDEWRRYEKHLEPMLELLRGS